MRWRLAIVSALSAAVVGSASAEQWPASLFIMTEQAAPISMMEGDKVVGSTTDKVREIMARTNINYSIELLPWKRAYTVALERPNACLYSTTRTAERENLFKWVGPTDQGDWILYARAGHQFKLNSLEDARALRIGTYNGDARDEYLRSRGFQVEAVQDEMMNARKLMLNRIDLWAVGMRHGSKTIEKFGYKGKVVPVLIFNRIKVFLACNPAVPDSMIKQMNDALAGMVHDGTFQKIDHKYDNWVAPH